MAQKRLPGWHRQRLKSGAGVGVVVTRSIQPRDLIRYLGGLRVTQGRLSGEPVTVFPWQARFIRGAFRPGATTAALSVARANGKTTLVAGIAAATLDGPLAVPRGETVIVASSFEQARIAFEHVLAFMGKLDKATWKVWDTAQQARIEHRATGARVRCIGSDPRRAHGLAPVLVLADEPAQWPGTTGERMVAALRTAAGKQPHSRFVALGTRPADSEHWFAKMLTGGADYAQCHAARPDDPPFWKRTWAKANPSLPYMPDLEDAIRAETAQARQDPTVFASFQALRLNLGTSDVLESHLIGVEAWKAAEGSPQLFGSCIWGIDLGGSAASSAVAAYWPETGRLDALAAFPGADIGLSQRGLRDGVGSLYAEMAKRGELILTPGHSVDPRELLREALARFGRPVAVASDRWREGELRDALQGAGIPAAALSLRGQGYKDGAEDVRLFVRAIIDKRARPVESLLLRSAMAEARTVSDPAGNQKLAKGSQGGRRARARDDAAAAAILAVAEGERRGRTPARTMRVAVAG